MSDIPPEIIVDIVRRLPVKSLLRFRCVSKPWCALIDSPDFIKSHLNFSLQNQTNTNIILRDDHLYLINIDSLDAAAVEHDHLVKPVSSEYSGSATEIWGSCNGLICLYDLNDYIVIWNPSTRKHFILPATDTDFLHCEYSTVHGFGYDQVNDDYKVVTFIQFFGDNSNLVFSEVKVYSLKSNLWRRIQDFPCRMRGQRDYCTLANGTLHWVANPRNTESNITNLIAAFDLVSEEYRLFPQPEFVNKDFHMTLGVLGDSLALNCNYYPHYFDVWVMKEYGVKGSWAKLLTIRQSHDIRSFDYLLPVAYSKSGGQVLLLMSSRPQAHGDINSFFWYDLEKGCGKTVTIHGALRYFEQFVCIESLVQPQGGVSDVGKQPAPAGPAQKKRKDKKKETKKRDDFLSVGFKLVL